MTAKRLVGAAQVAAAVRIFEERLKETAAAEQALRRLARVMPGCDHESILLKVAALNQLYGTNVYAVVRMASHIVRLFSTSPSWSFETVESVAALPPAGNQKKVRHHRSFASKFAHFFVDADRFPLLDSYAAQRLGFHLGARSLGAGFPQSYPAYARAFFRLLAASDLECRVVDLDKFLWLAGQHDVFVKGGRAVEVMGTEVVRLFRSKRPLDRDLVARLVFDSGRVDG